MTTYVFLLEHIIGTMCGREGMLLRIINNGGQPQNLIWYVRDY